MSLHGDDPLPRQPLDEMSSAAAELLLAQIDNNGRSTEPVYCPTELVLRDSA